MFARYKFVQKLTERTGGISTCLNGVAFAVATFSCIGMCFVATFQEYKLHVTSAVCEWIAAFTFIFFFYTYIQEFKHFTLQVDVQLREFL
ncbi:DNA damage-regulated autophagy modulator protein 1 [Bagarius yarrelli]|uniref:DNA damage-regulated autophagy modulator protein 1 n=1 Tax=Bagarius yarrelli TaxID=175774 RepID=A0A556TI76_BAGYA|nr:DNA damage-regulated autophagy modulator protein 1 [Bagarius yarrelli]